MASGKRDECDLWLWDGAAEYEGLLLKLDEAGFTARLRQAKKGVPPGGGLGKRLPASTPEAQRQFTRRRFLAHVQGTAQGTLWEARIENIQVSADGEFEHLVAGRFEALSEAQLEVLRTLSVQGAAAFFQRHAS
jgi:hypothetical protein